jgi:hypothetical protein
MREPGRVGVICAKVTDVDSGTARLNKLILASFLEVTPQPRSYGTFRAELRTMRSHRVPIGKGSGDAGKHRSRVEIRDRSRQYQAR